MGKPRRFTDELFADTARRKRRKRGESVRLHLLSKGSIWEFLMSLENEPLKADIGQSAEYGGRTPTSW